MENKKFTPGPWDACETRFPTGVWTEEGNLVSACGGFGVLSPEEMQANARLIAAAPDLYEALTDLHREIEMTTNIGWDDATEAALAKAEAALAKAVSA